MLADAKDGWLTQFDDDVKCNLMQKMQKDDVKCKGTCLGRQSQPSVERRMSCKFIFRRMVISLGSYKL
jgi:hypothetical protein